MYFQPAVDWRGEGTVRSHPLARVAAVVRRRASLRPTGDWAPLVFQTSFSTCVEHPWPAGQRLHSCRGVLVRIFVPVRIPAPHRCRVNEMQRM